MKIANVTRSRVAGAVLLALTMLAGLLLVVNPAAASADENETPADAGAGEDLYAGLPSMDALLEGGAIFAPADLPDDFGSEEYLLRTHGTTFAEAHELLMSAGAHGFSRDRAIMPFIIGHEPDQEMWHPITEIYYEGRRAAFGAVVNFSNLNPQIPAFCLDLNAGAPAGTTGTSVLQDASWLELLATYTPPERYDLRPAEIAQLLTRYAQNDQADASYVAALGLLTHVNFELSPDAEAYVGAYLAAWESNVDGQAHARQAVVNELVGWARDNTVGDHSWSAPVLASSGPSDRGEVGNVGVLSKNGKNISGLPFTLTLTGPAVFDATGSKTLSGTTGEAPLSFGFTATDNGEVQASVKYTYNSSEMYYNTPDLAGVQRTVQSPGPQLDSKILDAPEPLPVAVNFQPLLKSDVSKADSLVVEPGTRTLRDHLVVSADPDYSNPLWLGSGPYRPGEPNYAPLPVKFVGTVYGVGEEPAQQAAKIPSDAAALGRVELLAEGPGEYTVEASVETDSQFVTWVWSMDPAEQTHLSAADRKIIAGQWSDGFSTEGEITSVLWPGKIETNLKVHPTNDSTYLVDDVWISGLPTSHPNFGGGFGFKEDYPVLHQRLFFWPEGTPIAEGSTDDATLIGETTVPARNGFYPSQGSLDWKLVVGEDGQPLPGTYQLVHSFPGDDRVAAFTSPIPDSAEQYIVTPEQPSLKTTATNGEDGTKLVPAEGPVTIADNVCYEGLTPGKEYEISGTLMDQATGTPIEADGEPVTATVVHTPEQKDDCTEVVFEVDGKYLVGKTTVVFESVFLDGKQVAIHADINDEEQTVRTLETPTLKTTATNGADGTKIVAPAGEVKIVDSARYTNLTPGREYTVEGVLMDKSTGHALQVDGEDVTAHSTFSPEEADGCVEVEFVFDAGVLQSGTQLVVFETLMADGEVVTVHANLDDEGQTVTVEDAPGPAVVKGVQQALAATGIPAAALVLAAAAALGLGILAVVRRREL